MTDQELNNSVMKNKYYHLMLGICKYCKHFIDQGRNVKGYARHRCDKKESTVYEAYYCTKTDYLRGKLELDI